MVLEINGMKGVSMETRRTFFMYLLMSLSAIIAAFLTGCGLKPDAVTECSPEWPPKDEE